MVGGGHFVLGIPTLRCVHQLHSPRLAYIVASDPVLISNYFDLLENVLTENNLLDRPCQIFNMDESGMPLDLPHVKCVTKRDDRNPVAPSSGDITQITVVACVGASRVCKPSMVILDRKRSRHNSPMEKFQAPLMVCLVMVGWTRSFLMHGL